MPLTDTESEVGVFALVTDLCKRTACKYGSQSKLPQNVLVSKMRSQAYEMILKKSAVSVQCYNRDPIFDLLSYYFTSHNRLKNVVEYRRNLELKKIIDQIKQTDFGDNKDHIYKVVRLLVGLCDSVQNDHSPELFQKPFSYGLLNEMLPKPPRESFGSPQPYMYYPSHVFELPFSLKRQANLERHSDTYTEYTVESFESKCLLPELNIGERVEIKSLLSSAHFPSHTLFAAEPYSPCSSWKLPQMTAPRDLIIPSSRQSDCQVKVSFPSVTEDCDMRAVYRAKSTTDDSAVDIWELATMIDQDVPEDIWDIVSKMPPVSERQLIGTSPREMALWHNTYDAEISRLNVISERHFIRNIMYLTFGIETQSFPFSEEHNCFYMKENLVLEGISKEHIRGYVSDLLLIGTCYRRLYKFAFDQSLDDFQSHGLIYEAAREVIRRYLLEFRLKATEIYGEHSNVTDENENCLPTLLQVLFHMEPLKYEIETIASIFKLMEPVSECQVTIPLGADLMSYLFNEISIVTHRKTASILYNSFFTVCGVYFKFIERFIFEGELDDFYNEFFIRKDSAYVNTRSKRYWDKGFYIIQSLAVPEFLRPLEKFILLCGKSLRLLKLCNPSDPLLLISSDHPSVKCCGSFEELSNQQQVLDVYRTRCLFVSGEPVTIAQILLKREAERKAFADMATIQQARTHNNILAERKRLAQLIIAEKQHSLRVLEQAMAEAKAAKQKSKLREKRLCELEKAAEIAREVVDSKIRDDEKTKMLEYYSKLNEEVEKSKIHAEWKIKRLQLDESRVQMLSTEERNLKREKLELEHKRNEEIMAMSIQSIETKSEDENDIQENAEKNTNEISNEFQEPKISDIETNQYRSKGMIFAICSAAKNLLFKQYDNVDNKKDLDAQGNIVPMDSENNKAKTLKESTSSDVIGSQLNEEYDNQEFLKSREEALRNKKKVMAHEFGQIDTENNQVLKTSSLTATDEENNVKQSLVSFLEAKRNKEKVLGAEFHLGPKIHITPEPITDAQKEALINKEKVLGVEYNLPIALTVKNDPANVAQEEAIRNKDKLLGSKDYNLPLEPAVKNDPANIAQEEAIRNKDKMLGSKDYNLPLEPAVKNDPANLAQEEAIRNKDKMLGSKDYNLPLEPAVKNEPATLAQEEAIRNKDKMLGSKDYNLPLEPAVKNEPANLAQEEAIRNKEKILESVEYNLPLEFSETKHPANKAQEEAVSNKNKVLGSKDMKPVEHYENWPPNRSKLRLNLKPFGETDHSDTTNVGAITPGDFTHRLDFETPTTADIHLDHVMPNDVFTPHSEGNKLETVDGHTDKSFLSAHGFDFTLLDENGDSELSSNAKQFYTPNTSPSENFEELKRCEVDFVHGTYSLDHFDPFGVKDLKLFSRDYLTNKMEVSSNKSFYTHPALIMEEVKKKPYLNLFSRHESLDEQQKLNCDNIATLTACLQRSVMLPLTYQLEVVNNSILTYFLVNLEMYEHLTSLKDYFFLMDGEFCYSICQNLFKRLVKTLNPQDLLNFATLHSILDKALGSSISHVHKFSENLSFTITEAPLSFQHSSPDALQCLSLTYSVGWPLNIILSQEALLRYAKVFQFLLKIRRISWMLGQDFESLKLSVKLSKEHSRKLLKSPHYISAQIYRHNMACLIRALDNYIVTTCILSSWKEFENDLTKARTLDDLYNCHVVYIKKVLFKCLLNNRSTPVMKLLNDIFTVILKFSRVLTQGEWQQKEPNGYFVHSNYPQLKELFHLFEKLAKYLHKVIIKLMDCGYQRHLAELLTMVNMNGYYDFESSKEETNTSTQSV